MARSASTGRYIRVRGSGRRLQVSGADYGTKEVAGVRSGEVIYLSGGPAVEEAPAKEPAAKKG